MGCLGYLVGNSKSKNNKPDAATIAKPYIAALKRKIDELCVKREQAPPFICANGGNVCKNPCYEYQQKIETNCPKCGGEVTKDFENGKTEKEEWDRNKGMYVKKTYYDDNICTSFNWVDSYKAIDVFIDHFFEFFTRREDKPDGSFVEYMVVDGERFDAPPNLEFMLFIWKYNTELFPSKRKSKGTIFFYENNRRELGQAVGYYGYAWKHYVYLYTCTECKHKYHIIRTSPFKFRDVSLDKYIDSPKEYKKVNEGNEGTAQQK